MITDITKIQESLVALVKYCWNDEMRGFQEYFGIEIQSQDNLEPWIEWCETGTGASHVFYHLMVIKNAYPDLFRISTQEYYKPPKRTRITDMRGRLWAANYISLEDGKPYYCGMPVKRLKKEKNARSKHYYEISIMDNFPVSTIALTDEDYKLLDDLLQTKPHK